MKPTTLISSERSFPLTDYNYQSTVDAPHAVSTKKRSVNRLHGFWKLCTEFHSAEAVYGDATDFFVFTLMGICCTWPIFSVGRAIIRVFLGF